MATGDYCPKCRGVHDILKECQPMPHPECPLPHYSAEWINSRSKVDLDCAKLHGEILQYRSRLEEESKRAVDAQAELSDLIEQLGENRAEFSGKETSLNLQVSEFQKVIGLAMTQIGGWREVIAELDDMGKSEALGKAMYAALDQIDEWRKRARNLPWQEAK